MPTKKNTIKKIETPKAESKGRVFEGVVVSDKMKDTVVVKVVRFVKHPKYGKFQKLAKKFKADDKGNTVKIGDKVAIVECAPISKDKHFRILTK